MVYYSSWGDEKCVYIFGKIRQDNEIKQEVIAKYLNVATATYSRYETGTRNVPNLVLCKIADYFSTSTDYLLGRTDEKNPYKPKERTCL